MGACTVNIPSITQTFVFPYVCNSIVFTHMYLQASGMIHLSAFFAILCIALSSNKTSDVQKRPDNGDVVGRANLQPCGSLSRHTQEIPRPLPTSPAGKVLGLSHLEQHRPRVTTSKSPGSCVSGRKKCIMIDTWRLCKKQYIHTCSAQQVERGTGTRSSAKG